MKKLIASIFYELILSILFYAAVIILSPTCFAQENKNTSSSDREIRKVSDTVNNDKEHTQIIDKKYANKIVPKVQTIYIDKHSKHYYINNKGQKVYIDKAQLKNKPGDTSSVGRNIKNVFDTVANKVAEATAKGAAKIVDKTYKDKVGPQEQTIYIDKHSRYYYIDNRGRKIYVTKAQLKNKPVKL